MPSVRAVDVDVAHTGVDASSEIRVNPLIFMSPTKKQFALDVSRNDKVGAIKACVQQMIGMPKNQQMLWILGQEIAQVGTSKFKP